jgi:Tol biopolymer transport system component
MDVDGSDVTPLTDSGDDYDPSFSPDGSKIVFRSSRDGRSKIYTMNADDGSDVTPITTDGTYWHPVYSLDGARIFAGKSATGGGGTEIVVMDSDGRNEVPLTLNDVSDFWPATPPPFRVLIDLPEAPGGTLGGLGGAGGTGGGPIGP